MHIVRQYPGVVDTFRLQCADDLEVAAELEAYILILKEDGPYCEYPVCRKLSDDIWELRPQRRDGTKKGRLLYYWDEEKTSVGRIEEKAIIVYAFFKTTRKTPPQHIETAKRRRLELLKTAEEQPI